MKTCDQYLFFSGVWVTIPLEIIYSINSTYKLFRINLHVTFFVNEHK